MSRLLQTIKHSKRVLFHIQTRSIRHSRASDEVTPNRHSRVDIADWALNDAYHARYLIKRDPVLESILQTCEDHGLPRLSVSESHGKFLNLLARTNGARRILEVGTLGGHVQAFLRVLLAD
jgi:hypothetical protein